MRVRATAAAVTFGAMVAYPLTPRGGPARRALSTVVVGGLHATTLAAAARRWGWLHAVTAGVMTTATTGVAEHIGQRTGRPFGRYEYTRRLQPQVAGVPVLVPLAWFAMAVPARETAHAALGNRSTSASRVVVGAATLTAWDLFLDPQMVSEGYWRWAHPGAYRGIPVSNFVGWFAAGLGVMALLEIVLPPVEPAADHVATYAAMATMETLGFAMFFRDRVVATVGGFAMLPIASLAIARLVGQRP